MSAMTASNHRAAAADQRDNSSATPRLWPGFRYSAVHRTLWFGPQLSIRPFKTFFCPASGFGVIVLDAGILRIHVLEGELPVEKLMLTDGTQTRTLEWRTTVRTDAPAITGTESRPSCMSSVHCM